MVCDQAWPLAPVARRRLVMIFAGWSEMPDQQSNPATIPDLTANSSLARCIDLRSIVMLLDFKVSLNDVLKPELLTIVVRSIFLLLCLSGCSGTLHVKEHFGDYPIHRLNVEGASFVIRDHSEYRRLAIAPDHTKQFSPSFALGVDAPPFQMYQIVAETYLAGTEQTCEVSSPVLVIRPVYEIAYSCDDD